MEYFSLEKAIKILKKKKKYCSRGYLSKLARERKLKAVKIGNRWMTTEKWLKKCFGNFEDENKRKKTKIKRLKIKGVNPAPQLKQPWWRAKIERTRKIEGKKAEKEIPNVIEKKSFVLPLYFGYGLKISLVKLSRSTLNFTSRVFKKWWQEALAIFLLISILASSFFWYRPNLTKAATYNWVQTDWSGGASTDTASHPDNQTGWNYYYQADPHISTSTELSLVSSSGSVTQTSDTDFNEGSFATTTVYDTGNSAYVGLTCMSPDGTHYRKPITITENSGSDLTDYQVLVTLDTQSLISAGKMRSDCGDIRFTDSDETTQLNYWIESGCNTANTKIWVKVPSIPGNSTITIYMYYGNPDASSTSDASSTFIRVIDEAQPVKGSWHFDEGEGTTVYDSSGNNNDGTLVNEPTWVDGKFGKALSFDGSNDYVNTEDDNINSTETITFECWFKSNDITLAQGISSIVNTGYDFETGMNYFVVGLYNSRVLATAAGTPASSRMSSILQSSTWYHLVVIKTPQNISKIYINGVDDTNSATTNWGGDVSSLIGKIDITTDQYFNGIIDEVRIYNRTLSVEEISDLYNNYGYTTTNYPGKVLVRKYVGIEPSTTIGDEATLSIPSGTFTSSVIDASKRVSWETITWNATTSPSTTIKFQLSSSVDGVSWTNFVGPDGNTETYYTTSGNQIWQGHDGARYIKYKAYLETTNISETPHLNSVSIGYKYYPTVGDYSNYQYYRLINISNSTSTNLTDYQIKIELSTSTFDYSKVNSDGSDIRFYQEDGTKLNYWIESWNNTGTSTIWVKVPSIQGNSTTTIYMYYGNSDAISESNADNTFIFFDDFESGNLDKWTVETDSGSVSIVTDAQSGQYAVRIDDPEIAGTPRIRSTDVSDCTTAWKFWFKFADNPYGYKPELYTFLSFTGKRIHARLNGNVYEYYDGTGWSTIASSLMADTWYKIEFQANPSANTCDCYFNDSFILSKSLYEVASASPGMNISAGGNYAGRYYIDKVVLRKYADPEPSVIVGDEQLAYSLISSSYNTSDSENTLSAIKWVEDLPSASTTIKFQLRTSSDNSNWTDWMGPSGTSTYFTNSSTGCSTSTVSEGTEVVCDISSSIAIGDGSQDQYVQYKAFLSTTDTSQTPILKEVTLVYGVNSEPEFSTTSPPTINVTSSTQVEINYSVRDIDTNTASSENQGKLWPSFEYSLDGTSWFSIATSTLTGPKDNNPVILPISSPETFAATTTIWNAKQTSSNIYSTSTYIKITIDDHEKVHNATSTIVGPFTLDTKNPTLGSVPVSVDASQEPALITLSASDDSNLYMKVSLNSNLSDASWQDYSSSTTMSLETDPDTVYVQFKDDYGNSSNILSATTPETPTAVMIQDTSNMNLSPAEYRLFIAWKVVENPPSASFLRYNILRSDDGGNSYSKIAEVANQNTNYYADNTVSFDTVYYYKVTAEDENHNISFLSSAVYGKANGTQDSGEGGGGSDTTAPAISNVATSSITTNSVTITWDTDELSNSTVGYSATPSDFTNEVGVATMLNNSSGVGQHSVTLTGLTPNTTYYFQVKSTDPSGNTATSTPDANGYTFTTLPGPAVVQGSVVVEEVTNNTAKITWKTDKNSNSYVVFATSTSILENSPEIQGTNDSTTNHSVTLTGLTEGTKYYFYVKSTDSDNNTAYDKNVVDGVIEYYTFTTGQDATPPVISDISASVSTSTAIITWETNELANSRVDYGTTTSYGNTVTSSNLTIDHVINLSNLEPSTVYHYRVISSDANSNNSTSTDYTFTTQAPDDTTPPSITNVTVSSIDLTSAIITWNTDENSNSIVDYGETTSLGQMAGSLDDSSTSHSVTLTNLNASTTYYFQVRSQDSAGNTATDNNSGSYYSFVTQKDTTAPTISNVSASTVSDTKATITWTTNELSTSQVIYGTTDSYGSQTTEDTTLTYQHSVTLTGLTKETTYHYQVVSKDAANNSASSEDNTFTTTDEPGVVETIIQGGGGILIVEKETKPDESSPIVSDIKIEKVDYTSVTISWKTNEKTDSFIEYGATTDYEEGVFGKYESITSHSLTLTNLTPGTTYHFKILGKDNYGNLGSSADKTFTTLGGVTETSEKAVPEKEKGLVKKAVEILTKLSNPHSLASVSEALEESAKRVLSPPLVAGKYPKVEVGSDWAQITWLTDKKSNSLVAYAEEDEYHPERKDPYAIVAGNPDEMVTTHIVKLTNLKPSTVYHFQVRSKGKIGDWAKSRDKTFKTLSLLPEISDIEFISIKDTEVELSWLTTIPTRSKIVITNTKTGEKTIQEDKNFLTTHIFTIKNLQVATNYTLQIKAYDEKGNEAVSSMVPFSTSISENPPTISNIRITTALIPGRIERVQAIITWKTDKPATSRVYYQEGITKKEELSLKTPLDKKLVLDHIVVTTSFKPGKVYQFKVESIDSFGNRTLSKSYVILTPQPKQNVVTLIIKNFEETFGFLKRLRF